MIGKEVTTSAAAAASETETVAHPQGQVKGKQEQRTAPRSLHCVKLAREAATTALLSFVFEWLCQSALPLATAPLSSFTDLTYYPTHSLEGN